VFAMFMLAMRCVVFGVLLSHVRSEFRPVGRPSRFDFLGFLPRRVPKLQRTVFLLLLPVPTSVCSSASSSSNSAAPTMASASASSCVSSGFGLDERSELRDLIFVQFKSLRTASASFSSASRDDSTLRCRRRKLLPLRP